MKKHLFMAAVALALVGCAKESAEEKSISLPEFGSVFGPVKTAQATIKYANSEESTIVTTYTLDREGNILSCTMEMPAMDGKASGYNVSVRQVNGKKVLESTPINGSGEHTTEIYDHDGLLLSETHLYDGRQVPKNTYTYTAEGKIQVQLGYSTAGEPRIMTEYDYDEQGNLTEEVSSSVTGEVFLYHAYTYDADGRLIADSVAYDDGGKASTRYSYNADGLLAREEQTIWTPDEEIRRKIWVAHPVTTYTYDDAGRLLSKQTVEDGEMTDSVAYTYDPQGHILTTTSLLAFEDGASEMFEENTYDDHGNRLSNVRYESIDGDRQLASTTTFTYEYYE